MVQYEDKGLRMLCFPCNQFMGQEPWTEQEIKKWVVGKWPKLNPIMFSKIEVNGDNVDKTYKYLKTCFPGDINWNFATKFLVGKNGIPVQRFDKNQTWQEIEKCIQSELEKNYENKNEPQQNENVSKPEVESKENDDNKENDSIQDEVDKVSKELNDLKIKDEVTPNDVKEIQESIKSLQSNDDKVKQQISDLQSQLNEIQTLSAKVASSESSKKDENEQFDAKQYVEGVISSGAVVMISKSFCPFCKKAYEILSKYNKDIIKKEIDIDFGEEDMTAIQEYCKEKTGASSVPRVFIGGEFIGGCDDTEKLDKEDKLKSLIEAALNK